MLITPSEFLVATLSITALAALAQWLIRRRQVSRLRNLATGAGMHFSDADRFRLAPRLASQLPVPGAAGVRVLDLIYGVERECCRYVFAVEYTTGVLRTKTSVRKVAAYCEPSTPDSAASGSDLTFAPESLSTMEQYRHLLEHAAPPKA